MVSNWVAMGDVRGVPGPQRRDAVELLESVVESVTAGGPTPFRSVEFGPNGGELGFDVRRGSLIVEYQTRTNALEETPEFDATNGGLVDISEHVPLAEAGEEYAQVEDQVVDLVASAVPAVPVPEALDAVMVWPVPDEAGLYLVGFDTGRKKFIYAGGFRIPPSAMANGRADGGESRGITRGNSR